MYNKNQTTEPKSFQVTSGALRVTDPCYDIDTWCAGTLENVVNGTWYAKAYRMRDDFDIQMMNNRLHDAKENLAVGTTNVFFREYMERSLRETEEMIRTYTGRVSSLFISTNPESEFGFEIDPGWEQQNIDVGVDSGQAGFFDLEFYKSVASGDEVDEKFYDEIGSFTLDDRVNFGVVEKGTASLTGYGDGSYNCFVRRDSEGKINEAVIVFISECDAEEDEGDE